MVDNLLTTTGIVGGFILCYVTIVFVIATIRNDNSVMDIAYGPAFVCGAIGSLLYTASTSTLPLLITLVMAVWATRLSTRIFKKNYRKPEDARYAAWRQQWSRRGRWYFLLRSFLQIYLLQGSIIVVVASPFIVAMTTDTYNSIAVIVGGAIFILGLGIETLADWQLDRFIARKKAGLEHRALMTDGLFRYSRRPNYFGETLVWWGLAIIVFPVPYGWLAFISPLLITYIVTRVTGPMLEALFLKQYPEEYRAYMARTSYFIPLPPKHEV